MIVKIDSDYSLKVDVVHGDSRGLYRDFRGSSRVIAYDRVPRMG